MSSIKALDEIKICRAALHHFGTKIQVAVCLEELAELQQVLCKIVRFGANSLILDKLAEEIADVEIMLKQMRLAFGVSAGVERWKTSKLERLRERIAKG